MSEAIRVYRIRKGGEESVICRDKPVWIGIDDHKSSMSVTVLDSEDLVYQTSFPAERKHLRALLRRLPGCKVSAVYEAGPTGYRLLRWLKEEGCEAMITPPSLVPVAANRRVKTDRRDSFALALALRAGMLKKMHDLTDEQYAHRELVRTREQVVAHRADVQRQIKSKLLYHRIEPPDGINANWARAFVEWLEDPCTGQSYLDTCLKTLVSVWQSLTTEVKFLTKEVTKLSKTEEYVERVKLLDSIRGVGVLTAAIILTEVQDFDRFRSEKEFASYLGLVPREKSSGDGGHKGRITGAGNRRVRTALVESSWTLKRHDKELARFFERVSGGKKERRNRAIVAVARKLSARIRAIMVKGEAYKYPSHQNSSSSVAA